MHPETFAITISYGVASVAFHHRKQHPCISHRGLISQTVSPAVTAALARHESKQNVSASVRVGADNSVAIGKIECDRAVSIAIPARKSAKENHRARC